MYHNYCRHFASLLKNEEFQCVVRRGRDQIHLRQLLNATSRILRESRRVSTEHNLKEQGSVIEIGKIA